MPKYCIGLLLLLIGCSHNNTLNIYIENGSASQKIIPVEIYINDSLSKTVEVTKGEKVTNSKHVGLLLPPLEQMKIVFKVPGTGYKTECIITPKKLTSKTWMHVALRETVFKKGYEYNGRTLNKDTIIERGFYCEFVDQPVCGQIEE